MLEKILIVEDEPVIAADIEFTLTKAGYLVVGIANNSTQALDMIVTRQPDLVLLDIAIKGDRDGIDVANIMMKKHMIPFVFLTSFSDRETLERAKTTLPLGYIVKPFKDKDVLSTIEIALYRFNQANENKGITVEKINNTSSVPVTETEYKVIQLIWEGKANKQIAETLFVSINTIKTHLKNIFEKLDVNSRTELIAKLRNGSR
jgi:two-component system, response regulator PdtaR